MATFLRMVMSVSVPNCALSVCDWVATLGGDVFCPDHSLFAQPVTAVQRWADTGMKNA
jgi:hypothetical protein